MTTARDLLKKTRENTLEKILLRRVLGNVNFLLKKKNFRNGSRLRAGWRMRFVLVRATPRAEVDVIGVNGFVGHQ